MYSKNAAIDLSRQFIAALQSSGIRVRQAYLFGSYAADNPHENSDIDLAVVSSDFSGFRFDDLGKIAPQKITFDPDLEIHPFAARDFSEDNPFVKQIVRTGVKVM